MSAHLSLPSECGERHEARLAERSEAELAKVFDRIVKGCWMPATKLGLGRRKSHHPFSLPRCECIVSGCWRRTVHVVLPSDGEHISQLHATQLRVDGCGNNGQTQPSEERHSLGSGRGGRLCRLAQNDQYKAPLAKESASLFPSVFNQSRYSGERIITSSMRGAGRTKAQRQRILPRPHPSSSSSRDGALTCVQNAFERPYRGQFGFAAGEVNVMHQ